MVSSEEEVAAEIEVAVVVEIEVAETEEAVVEIEAAAVEIVEAMVVAVPAANSKGHRRSNATSKKNVKSLVPTNPRLENERKQRPQQIRVKLRFKSRGMHASQVVKKFMVRMKIFMAHESWQRREVKKRRGKPSAQELVLHVIH
jgi:hypothetical protein